MRSDPTNQAKHILSTKSATLAVAAILLFSPSLGAQTTQPATTQATAPTRDSTYIAPNGTAYITRVIPVPSTISPAAQKELARQISDAHTNRTIEEGRRANDLRREHSKQTLLEHYPATVTPATIAGVPVTIVTPLPNVTTKPYVLINVHGGALMFDCCSLSESIPLASIMHVKVIAVLYRLAPEHPFPAGVDDVIAVYRQVLKDHAPSQVILYGTSAGAVITGEVAQKLKLLGLPEPAALGIFSGFGDFTRQGDSQSFFTGAGLGGYLTPPDGLRENQRWYAGKTPLDDTVLSPQLGDLSGLPPTLFLTSTRDWFLSGTTIFHRAMLRAGDDAQLVVFEALGHAFWEDPTLPESAEADHLMASFFEKHLKTP